MAVYFVASLATECADLALQRFTASALPFGTVAMIVASDEQKVLWLLRFVHVMPTCSLLLLCVGLWVNATDSCVKLCYSDEHTRSICKQTRVMIVAPCDPVFSCGRVESRGSIPRDKESRINSVRTR